MQIEYNDKEWLKVLKGLDSFDELQKLRRLLEDNFTISYILDKKDKDGYYNINIHINKKLSGDDIIIPYQSYHNTLSLYDILYEIAEIYCSDESNPCYITDSKLQPKLRRIFTDSDIALFPSEIVENQKVCGENVKVC